MAQCFGGKCAIFVQSKSLDPFLIFSYLILKSVFNGMQALFVPYSLMKVNPASWMLMITKFRGNHQDKMRICQLCSSVSDFNLI